MASFAGVSFSSLFRSSSTIKKQASAAPTPTQPSPSTVLEEIHREIAANPICVYGKGTEDRPLCRFTVKAIQTLKQYGYPVFVIDVHDQPAKKSTLKQLTHFLTWPQVFIGGTFYGGFDDLTQLERSGALNPLLKKAFQQTA